MIPLIFVAIFAVVAVGAWYVWRREQQRRAALASFAAGKGWTFSVDDPYDLSDRWQAAPFGRGDSRQASDVFSGTAPGGFPMLAFDYKYVEHSTDSKGNRSSTTYRFTVCALRLPAYLPALHVGKENVLTRIGSAIGMGDIEFESEDFNRAFRVSCPDPKFASDILHPRAMELLLQHGRGTEWRFEGADMLCWRQGRLGIPDLLQRLDLMSRVIQSIPTFVWKDRGYDPGTQAQTSGGR